MQAFLPSGAIDPDARHAFCSIFSFSIGGIFISDIDSVQTISSATPPGMWWPPVWQTNAKSS
jgi:hypothetical protein